ncbi:hypothetical protein ID866_9845, partial [Astraeus odoratus]
MIAALHLSYLKHSAFILRDDIYFLPQWLECAFLKYNGRGVNCTVLVTFNQLAASASIGLACINLAIRTCVYMNSCFEFPPEQWIVSQYGKTDGGAGAHIPGGLAQRIVSNGIIYFIAAFLSNLLASVFILLQLNPPMTVMFHPSACVFSM